MIRALCSLVVAVAVGLTACALPGKAAPPAWVPFEAGFEKDAVVRRSGAFALRCTNAVAAEKRGGQLLFTLNQKRATPVVVAGWSRAQNVSGQADNDYSVYADLEYDDGSHAWGFAAPFETGTHGWQRRRVTITPDRPIKTLLVYALLRGHAGTAWFDDFSATTLAGPGIFDSQALAPPRLAGGASSGWFIRDVAANGGLRALMPGGKPVGGFALSPVKTECGGGRIIRAALKSTEARGRAVTLYYVERFDAPRGPLVWGKTVRETQVLADGEGTNAVSAGGAGATGTHTCYPFGCVTGAKTGRALAVPPDLGPRIVRIGYHPGARLLYAAFDLAFPPGRAAPAPVAVARYPVSPEWGFRDAARTYYALFPGYYARRTKAEGIWLPFTDPANVANVADFGIAWHEGDNSVAGDDKRGILSFRYVEPMSFWMNMPPGETRDYPTALARLKRLASGAEPASDEVRHQALATLATGATNADDRFAVQFQNAPWANGAVWTLNPNPRIPHHGPNDWTKARVNYDPADANRRYGSTTDGTLDGEYLDSMEGWANVLDYGAQSLRFSLAPPTFASESFRPVVPTWFSVWEYADWLRADLHRRGKLLMGNATPWTVSAFAPLLDAGGTETNWLGPNGAFQPESDALMCWRRTLSGRKPYLLLQNTDFDKFGTTLVEKYFQRCLFYGIFPSMFSLNAADKPYWENAQWYERDRPLFKKYVPVIQRLSAAGWEPVTHARADRPTDVYLERFGGDYLCVRNVSPKPVRAVLTVDLARFAGGRQAKGSRVTFTDALAGNVVPASAQRPIPGKQDTIVIALTLAPEETRVLHLNFP